jgi:rSAM/selenodomain-associated transferase 2
MPTLTTLSIIVPVLRESAGINNLIAHLRRQSGDATEIIVVDGDFAGTTNNVVRDPGVLKLIARRGRASQMNHGASVAGGEVLLFLHADTLLPENAFSSIRKVLEDRRIVGGAFDLGFDTDQKIYKITELYVRLRTRLTKVPFGDQAIFIRRDYFRRIGGFRDIPIMEDVDLMKRIRREGGKIAIIPDTVRTSPRRYEREGVLFCTFRNWILQFLFAWGVPPERLAKWYR